MSVRTRLAGAVAVVATASASLAFLPGTANAVTPAAPKSPLTITASPAQPGPLLPGHSKSFDVTVTNRTGAPVTFLGDLTGAAHGAIPMDSGHYARVSVDAVHAPATDSVFGSQDDSLIGSFFPKGGHWGSTFKIPAHASYTWKVTVEATKAFPINDDRLEIGVGAAGNNGKWWTMRSMPFRIGAFNLKNGGPITTTVTGGHVVGVTKPLILDVRWTNHTGLALATTLYPWIGDKVQTNGAELAFDVWNGHRWVHENYERLFPIRAGLANGASVTEKVRIRIVGRADQAVMGPATLYFTYEGFAGLTSKVIETTNQ